MKYLLIMAIVILGLQINSNAQIPNYVPTNGLVGWWPFNGNANDESGNDNNGIPSGASLTYDRFGNLNQAYSFDGIDDYIEIPNYSDTLTGLSVSIWFNQTISGHFIDFGNEILGGTNSFTNRFGLNDNGNVGQVTFSFDYSYGTTAPQNYVSNGWNHLVATWDGINMKVFINNNILSSSSSTVNEIRIFQSDIKKFGSRYQQLASNQINFGGIMDDIGIWNRALTLQEVANLFNTEICSNNTTISPQTNSLTTGSTATFNATTLDPNPSYVWQSDLGQGFQTLNNYGNYSGVNTNSLSISNVQLPNHTQPIRVISTSGECIDTSNVATINIIDTCIVTINDTITTLISVTDTLVINTIITGITPPNNSNTIKVFPNPANSHITIDFGNFESMNGYSLTITNSVGQTIYTTPINEQSSYIDLSTWGGNGMYFVQIIDTLNNTIENRKIVLQ